MWKEFKVIDADAHMHEPQYLWERYVEPKFRDQVPKVAFMDGVFMIYEPDGKFIPKGEIQSRPPESAWRVMEAKYGEAYRQWWSPEIRLKDMDRYGWDKQVLLPTGNNGNFAYRVALKDVQLGAAMCRAYNNCEHDFPIAVHGEYRQRRFQPFRKLEGERREDIQLALRGLDHALSFPCDNMTTLGHFIFTGILERFPKLRLGILESNAGWLPFWLGRMDDHTHGRNSVMGKSEKLRMLPSE